MQADGVAIPDEDLIRGSARGDRDAFDALVGRHGAAMFRFAARTCGSDAEAADALQEALLAAWRGAASFRGDAAGRTWLYQILVHACRRRRRRRAGEPERHAPLEDALGVAGGSAVDDRVAAREAGAAMERALAAMAEEAREVLLLRDVEGLSGADTAAALGLDLAAMKSRLHRARLDLKARVETILGHPVEEILS
jgi:RNA polymerase sigma-70 factor (ECF subfamily)